MPGFFPLSDIEMMRNMRNSPGPSGWPGHHPHSRDFYAYHDPVSAANVSTTVVHALADVMGRDISDAGFVLYDSIDPDSLDRIFSPTADGTPRPPGHVAFTVDGYRVTVYSSGQIVITPPDPSLGLDE